MPPQRELFQGLSSLAWIPGETLFSLASRHHQMWGYSVSSRSAILLFGHPQGGTQHDLPNRIDEFSNRTMAVYGTSRDVALQRTLLSFYAPFMSPTEIDNAVACMSGNSVAHLKLRLVIHSLR